MKKLSLLCAAAFVAATAMAQSITPEIFNEDFSKMDEEYNAIVAPWVTYGNGAQPGSTDESVNEYVNYLFSAGKEAPYYVPLQYGSTIFAVSCNNFVPSTEADQWLVSPEIEIPENEMSLSFTVGFYNNQKYFGDGSVPVEIYISEKGNAKESFGDTPIYTYTMRPSTTTPLVVKNFVIPVNGYKGKKINIAFVQKGMNAGPTGFTKIGLGQYYCKFDASNTPVILTEGSKISIDNNLEMKTPVACGSIHAVLEIDGVKVDEKDIKKNLGGNGTTQQYVRVSFTDVMDMPSKSVNYRLLITPDFEGAMTSEYIGTIGYPVTSYRNNCVVEEITASGCQYCPAGTASMEYYAASYPAGHPTRGKFIGIAIHGNINYLDPMSVGVSAYLSQALEKVGTTNYPNANFNRGYVGQNPWDTSSIQREIASKSYSSTLIKEVTINKAATTEDLYDTDVNVKFDVLSAYDASSRLLNASVVMIENDVKGFSDGYNQSNAFYNRTESFITSNYGSFLVPYMKKYLAGGEFGTSSIRFDKVSYQHVARGVFPSYNGESISGEWQANQPREMELNFKFPDNVMDWENTEIIVLITDESQNGKIVASDIFPASSFTKSSGVKNILGESEINISRNNQSIIVKAAEKTPVAVYAIDGTLLGKYIVEDNSLSIDGSSFNGVVIVKAGNKTSKLIF